MNVADEQAREYDRMRGQYLGLVASLEMNLTFLLAEWLEVGNHRTEFHKWFMEAPIRSARRSACTRPLRTVEA